MDQSKIKSEIFKLSILGKLLPFNRRKSNTILNNNQRIVNLKSDELGYFSSLDNL